MFIPKGGTMTSTLLLNASFEPLTVLSWKRAMLLVLDERAEVVVADEDDPVRSQFQSFPRPLVIRLIAYVKIPYRAKVALNKRNLYSRDGGQCQYCGEQIGMTSATIDHIVPRSRGGKNIWENVCLACDDCNYTKGSHLLSELGWTLRTEPRVPRREGRHILVGLVAHETWSPYLTASALA
jgi:5-methylcytosine-specific restriction endonuclease McrA